MRLEGPKDAKNPQNAGPNHSSEETVELFFRVPSLELVMRDTMSPCF
jgi:hypothetical protein